MRQVSHATKIEQLEALLDTPELTPWEQRFVFGVASHLARHRSTERLTLRQLEVIDRIWERHFA